MEPFENILAHALETVAAERGWQYAGNGSVLWAGTGVAYLSLALLDGSQEAVRSCQYQAREVGGQVLVDCHQYERLACLCLEDSTEREILIPGKSGRQVPVALSKDMFLEMLDFLRDG